MRTYPIIDANGHYRAFEIESVYIGLRKIEALLAGVTGITDIRRSRLFGSSNDIRLSFRYQDEEMIVWEPYGDNSRYWIGPKHDDRTPVNVASLITAFDRYTPPLFVKVLGDIVSLNFESLFHRKT